MPFCCLHPLASCLSSCICHRTTPPKFHAAWLQKISPRMEALHGVKNGFHKKRSALDDYMCVKAMAASNMLFGWVCPRQFSGLKQCLLACARNACPHYGQI